MASFMSSLILSFQEFLAQGSFHSLSDYSQMKEMLAMEVVSAETNAEMLATVPHQNIEDMAVVYRFVLNSDEVRASILMDTHIIMLKGN